MKYENVFLLFYDFVLRYQEFPSPYLVTGDGGVLSAIIPRCRAWNAEQRDNEGEGEQNE